MRETKSRLHRPHLLITMKPKSALRGIAAAFALATPVIAANRYWDGGTADIATNGDNIDGK